MRTIRERDAERAALVTKHPREIFTFRVTAEDCRALIIAGDALAEAVETLTGHRPHIDFGPGTAKAYATATAALANWKAAVGQ